MENYKHNEARKELGSYLAECKKAYRKTNLDRKTTRYIANEINALETLLA